MPENVNLQFKHTAATEQNQEDTSTKHIRIGGKKLCFSLPDLMVWLVQICSRKLLNHRASGMHSLTPIAGEHPQHLKAGEGKENIDQIQNKFFKKSLKLLPSGCSAAAPSSTEVSRLPASSLALSPCSLPAMGKAPNWDSFSPKLPAPWWCGCAVPSAVPC